MSDLTHIDLKKDIDKNSEKLDRILMEMHELKVELLSITKVNSSKIEQHEKEINHAFEDIHKIEERTWRAGGALVLGLVSLLGTAALAALTFLAS